jgi:hypothetical protein
MMRFITHHLTSINGVEIFPMLSLLIFVSFFALVLIRVWRMTRQEADELSELPFNEDETSQTTLSPTDTQ